MKNIFDQTTEAALISRGVQIPSRHTVSATTTCVVGLPGEYAQRVAAVHYAVRYAVERRCLKPATRTP